MTESWVSVREWPGYEVSDLGRVRSLDRIVARFNSKRGREYRVPVKGRMLKLVALPYPYTGKKQVRDSSRPMALAVNLYRGSEVKMRYVHHLVLEAFVGLRPQGTEACHLDGNAGNNALLNLRWGTHKENVQDSIRHGTFYPRLRSVV